MKKILLIIVAPFVFFSGLSAQITQEKADEIVSEYLQQEALQYVVYAKEGVQTNMTISGVADEMLELDYACRVYYVNFADNTGCYLIVKESNGNVLKINDKGRAKPNDLAEWRELTDENSEITKSVFSGYVQKGPYIVGSSVMITLLDKSLNQTGSVFSTQIVDNSGTFEQRNIKFASNYVELKADGYYFNEVKGENSAGSLSLYALVNVSDINSVNINVLTHLERQRIYYLMQNNKLNFSAAKNRARSEVLNIFRFALPENVAAESLDIADDALLLAVSVIVQGHLSPGDLSELLANISSDIRIDGRLDNPILGSQLMNNVAFLDLDKVISNMEKKYGGLGITLNVTGDQLKSYIDQFKNNCGFEQTLGITYPGIGKYGPNILAESLVDAKPYENGKSKGYSIRAELPAGNSSLKVVIKSESASPWGGYFASSAENWLISSYDNNIKGNTFTVYESGKPADLCVSLDNDFIIEYYENGATTPTKVKRMSVGKGDTAADDEHEREMLIAFYQSTNGDNWIRKDNWCSDKPMSEWYGVETQYHAASAKSRVKSIELPDNNLTGAAYVAELDCIYVLNILSGNKIDTLTIESCGRELKDSYPAVFYHDYKSSQSDLKALNISNSKGSIYANGNFSAKTVTISNCNTDNMYFNLASTKVETMSVSGCTIGSFYADSSIIGNTTIDNCSFSTIFVGNKTLVSNSIGSKYIYGKSCSDLTVTNTVCDDVRCGN